MPVEHEIPKSMFGIFSKDISVAGSLDKWEESLTTNSRTDYEAQVAREAVRISAKNYANAPPVQTPQAAQISPLEFGGAA